MKKVFVLIILLIFFFIFSTQKLIINKKRNNNYYQTSQKSSPTYQISKNLTLSKLPNQKKEIKKINFSIFVPYWQIPENINEIKEAKIFIKNKNHLKTNYIYFGITANENGINKNEVGFFNLEKINTSEEERLFSSLVLRLLNDEINSKILENKNLQQKIIEEAIKVTKEKNFSELILDLEINTLPFENVINQINSFVTNFAQKAKSKNLIFSMTIYGDTFYRKRPYDIKFISSKTDKIYVMAYDFHKTLGNPGPNFPLFGKDEYGYDLSMAIKDFITFVPDEKLIFIFGFYGYDWVVDEKNRPIKAASPLTLNQIKKRFFHNPNIQIKRDSLSLESKIEYFDDSGYHHIVWFEDEFSVEKKQEFLLKQKVYQFGYWAFGYY